MMRGWTIPFRVISVLVLAALTSAAWLFRQDIVRAVKPQITRVAGSLGLGVGDRGASSDAVERVRDKVDSLHGWALDSITLDAVEMATLVAAGLPPEVRRRLNSLAVSLGDGVVTLSARVETTHIPREALGLLADALDPWEPVSASGPVFGLGPGRVGWRVDGITLRGFTLPPETTHRLIDRNVPGARDGVLPVPLPKGVRTLRVRPDGVTLYREARL
jgi:hypothetical protein